MTFKDVKKLHNSTARIVLGPGALGSFMLWDISKSTGVLPTCVGECESRRTYEIRSGSEASEIDVPVVSVSDLPNQIFNKKPETHYLVYVTLPPQNAETVTCESLKALATMPHIQVTVVYCSNGLLQQQTIETLYALFPKNNLKIVRAIVVAGFERHQKDAHHFETLHTGGVDVRFGEIPRSHVSESDKLEISSTKKLEWTWVENIQQIEFKKFFVNCALAFALGPKNLSNKQYWQEVPLTESESLAKIFAAVSKFPILAEQLMVELEQTISKTQHNTNSVSRAAARGNFQAFLAFFTQFENLFYSCKNLEHAFPKFFKERLQTLWQVSLKE